MTSAEIDAFWHSHTRFLQCTLTTESPHPKTTHLSHLAQHDLPQALSILKNIDAGVLKTVQAHLDSIDRLSNAINSTIQQNGRIYILGCGASGRMAVCLETAWRQLNHNQQVVGIIAGGDFALVRSIEQFEDRPELGIKQLQQQGFTHNDLLIATTASGESPFILAATHYAAKHCKQSPWLVYCNPNEQLIKRAPNHIIQSEAIRSWCLDIGPMALTGSTRMQATTAMQLGLGLALLTQSPEQELTAVTKAFNRLDIQHLVPFIEYESSHFKYHSPPNPFIYQCDDSCALTVMTDLTERTPTFNIPSLDTIQSNSAWYQLQIAQCDDNQQAWHTLRQRSPYCLQWPDFPQTAQTALSNFNFCQSTRANLTINQNMHWQIGGYRHNWCINRPDLQPFYQQLLNKMLLNMHSTLVMGRLGFYQGNIMTNLQPTNHKLIDRAIRYIQYCYQQQYQSLADYQTVANIVFDEIDTLEPNDSIVDKCLSALARP